MTTPVYPAEFDGFTLSLSHAEVYMVPRYGAADVAIAMLRTVPGIARQLSAIDPAVLRRVLSEYGAWDIFQLSDHDANLSRILWIAADDIRSAAGEEK